MTFARYLPRFRQAQRAVQQLAERESWSREQIEALQISRINQIWKHARNKVSHYRELASERSLPPQFESLEHFRTSFPILSKAQLRAESDRFLSTDLPQGSWHRTGGSTGVPLRVYWSEAAHREMLWNKYRMLQDWGLDVFARTAFLWGHAASFESGWRGVWQRRSQVCLDWLRNRTRFNAYRLGEADIRQYLDELNRRKIACLYGYSSSIALMAAEARRLELRFPALRLSILTAEPADEAMIADCRRGLQTQCAIEYGSVECGVIATGRPDGTLRVCEDVVYLESLPRSDGRCDLVVTVLNNPCFPLIRYAIEDITDTAIAHETNGHAILKNISGRSNDLLLSSTGRIVHPLAVKHALESLHQVRRFSAHQDAEGNVCLELETTEAVESSLYDNAVHKLAALLEGYEVSVRTVSQLEGNRAGKHRWVTSALARSRVHDRHPQSEA